MGRRSRGQDAGQPVPGRAGRERVVWLSEREGADRWPECDPHLARPVLGVPGHTIRSEIRGRDTVDPIRCSDGILPGQFSEKNAVGPTSEILSV